MNQEKYIGYLERDIADILNVTTHVSYLLEGKITRLNGVFPSRYSVRDLERFAKESPLERCRLCPSPA